MNPAQPTKSPQPDLDELGPAFLAHLAEEEEFLQTTVEALGQTRTALVSGSLQTLRQALQRQATLEQAGAEMRDLRNQLRHHIASVLGVPAPSATLELLAGRVPAHLSASLKASRQRLRCLAATANELNRGNALLLKSGIDLLDQVLSGLTGGSPGGKRYGPAGGYQQLGCGSLVSARG
jgi:hypothetical protein